MQKVCMSFSSFQNTDKIILYVAYKCVYKSVKAD